jgi:hypothetical protein
VNQILLTLKFVCNKSNWHPHFIVFSPILADCIFNDCAFNIMHVSSNMFRHGEMYGSGISNCEDCCLVKSDAMYSGGCVLTF